MLELRKYRDDDGAIAVELVGSGRNADGSDNPDPPAEHGFADDYVLRGVEEGWFSFDNGRVETDKPVTAEVDGDEVVGTYGGPEHSGAIERTQEVRTGDAIILHLTGGDLRYKINERPGVYGTGDDEPADIQPYRVSHEYVCELEV